MVCLTVAIAWCFVPQTPMKYGEVKYESTFTRKSQERDFV
jgi:hypothetical protein